MPKRSPNVRIVAGLVLSAACLLAILWLWSPAQASTSESEGCLEEAAAWARVHPTLLRAIAWVESRGHPKALNWNHNGSYDVGLMQINSSWYRRGFKPWWRALGLPCVNVAAATWILKECMESYGYTWNAVGCYHAGSGWERGQKRRTGERYIRRVQQTITTYARSK